MRIIFQSNELESGSLIIAGTRFSFVLQLVCERMLKTDEEIIQETKYTVYRIRTGNKKARILTSLLSIDMVCLHIHFHIQRCKTIDYPSRTYPGSPLQSYPQLLPLGSCFSILDDLGTPVLRQCKK